jgi:hypothetical protein
MTPLEEATTKLHEAALAVARLLLSESGKQGWQELAALEEASVAFYRAQPKPAKRRR